MVQLGPTCAGQRGIEYNRFQEVTDNLLSCRETHIKQLSIHFKSRCIFDPFFHELGWLP